MTSSRKAMVLFAMLVACGILSVLSPVSLAGTSPDIKRMVLSNRLVVLISEEHSLPFVTCRLLVNAGSWRDPAGEEGLANLAANSILLGTRDNSLFTINRKLDQMGSSLDSSCGRDYAVVGFRALKREFDKGFGILMEVLTQPSFPANEVDRQRAETIAAIQAQQDQPEVVAEKEFRKALFKKSPYGHPVEGTMESVRGLTREAAVGFYGAYFRPNNSVLAIAGDITEEEVRSKLVPSLDKWKPREIPDRPFESEFVKGPLTVKKDRPITQANVILGHRGISRSDKDYYAASLMNYILGGAGLGSRLMEEIRIRRGLAYSVYSHFDALKRPGSFQILLQTKNESAKEAVQICFQEMKKIQEEGVTEEELETAKRYHIGSFPMRFDSQEKLAEFIIQIEFYGLGLDYPEHYPSLIRSVTREDIQKAAKTYLHPDHCVLSVVADLKKADLEDIK